MSDCVSATVLERPNVKEIGRPSPLRFYSSPRLLPSQAQQRRKFLKEGSEREVDELGFQIQQTFVE